MRQLLISSLRPLFLLSCLCPAYGLAQDDPLSVVRGASNSIIERLEAEPERVRNEPEYVISLINQLLLPHVAEQIIARRVLGDTWQSATQEQKQRFVKEFRRYMVRFYAQIFMIYSGEKVDYSTADDTSNTLRRRIVSHITQENGQSVQAIYRVEKREGVWKVTDIVVDGVSLVHTNRLQYKHLIERDGLDTVLDRLASHNRRPLR